MYQGEPGGVPRYTDIFAVELCKYPESEPMYVQAISERDWSTDEKGGDIGIAE